LNIVVIGTLQITWW